jgi:FAD/FMN-containing dehydrogenase
MPIDTAPLSALIDALAGRLGPAHVMTSPIDLEGHLIEARGLYRGTAAALVRPRDVGEVAFVVRECASARVPVVPQGGNTGLVGGGVPHGGVVLSLARLDRVLEIDPSNATLTVEAGCILKHVQEAADRVDCMFPLSLPSEGSCRIGGNLATNAGGTGVLRYGNTRENVLGLEAVLADGRVWDGLYRLRKNNTGFDLKHLFVGSEGTLGVITRATLALRPLPQAPATLVAAFGSTADAGAAVSRVVVEGIVPSLMEIMDRTSIRAVEQYLKTDLNADAAARRGGASWPRSSRRAWRRARTSSTRRRTSARAVTCSPRAGPC